MASPIATVSGPYGGAACMPLSPPIGPGLLRGDIDEGESAARASQTGP
ncbi:hypothetical protein [Streptomyces sp. NPDC060022]